MHDQQNIQSTALKACGIVAEYNPFHNGHLHHLREAKRLTGLPVIAVMSGSIMQRGEPAFLDKWTRARLAALCGADLVLELPAAFSLRSAQYFAQGAVRLLQATGLVSALACGAETSGADFPALATLALSPSFQECLRRHIQSGLSYAAAMEKALQEQDAGGRQLHSLRFPNDILALEYSKALHGSGIAPYYIQRTDAGYTSDALENISCSAINNAELCVSASTVRRVCREKRPELLSSLTPPAVAACLQKATGYDARLLWQLLCWRLRLLTPAAIAARCLCSEGLENVLKQMQNCSSLEAALAQAASARCPASRLRRLLLQLLLDKPRAYFLQQQPAYLRVLAFNGTGRSLLRQMKHTATLPVITKLGRNIMQERSEAFCQQLELELAASDLLALLQNPQQNAGSDFLTSPACVQNEP